MNNKQGGDQTQDYTIELLIKIPNEDEVDLLDESCQYTDAIHNAIHNVFDLDVETEIIILKTPDGIYNRPNHIESSKLLEENKRLKEINEKMLEALKTVKINIQSLANRQLTPIKISKELNFIVEFAKLEAAIKLAE